MLQPAIVDESERIESPGLWSLSQHQPVPRDANRLLVAVASSSSDCIDGSFEDAEAFLLYEKCGEQTSYIGRQPCPLTLAGNDPGLRARLLADCDLVLCTGISEVCMQKLNTLGVACNLADAGTNPGNAVSAL